MKTFEDLNFKPIPIGKQARLDFENGYGVSVVIGAYTYGGDRGLYELAVMVDGDVCYDTPVTDDVEGSLSPEQVTELMCQVQKLPNRKEGL